MKSTSIRLEVPRKEPSRFTQISKSTRVNSDSALPQTAPQALLARLLEDLAKLSDWLNAIVRAQHDISNAETVALQKSVRRLPVQWQDSGASYVFDAVTVDFAAMETRRDGTLIALKTTEFKLLTYLIRNSGRVISREELLREVWGYKSYPHTRTVDNHIFNLRQKLEAEPSRPRHFLTIHGAGYKFLPLEAI